MDHSLFISDLHLCESRPEINKSFIDFLNTTAKNAQALYILGDFFEYWAGDDAIEIGVHQAIIESLKTLSSSTKIFLMHGNRDFLIGKNFEKASGAKLLPDPSILNLYGKSVLLSHGDSLCTDDHDYQKFRNEVRSANWQSNFLNQPLQNRIAYIAQLRAKSEQEKSTKSMQIMDVNPIAVSQLLQQFNVPSTFIHGHTHRPKKHIHVIDGKICERWVLGDWYEQGSYLMLDANGCHVVKL
jgi:UDP-2,3-diacylglucosamine hydrolase